MFAAGLLVLLASADELYRQGVDLFQKGEHDRAIAVLESAARLRPRHGQTWKALGVVHAAREDYEGAREPFEKACASEPELEDACYFHGRNLYALNLFEPAVAVLKMSLPRDSKPWRVRLGIAQAEEALGRASEAEADFRSAVAEYTKAPAAMRGRPDFDPRLHYAVFLFRQGRTEEAFTPAEASVADYPASGRAHLELGRIQYQLGKLTEAHRLLRRAVEIGAGEPAVLLLRKLETRLSGDHGSR